MAELIQPRGSTKESAWAPLRVKAFRALWLAQVGSAIGTWMQTVGAQWLLVEEPGAEALVAMVQVAAMLPALVLALPSGALADILDRRRMLIAVQLFQACVAVVLAALTVAGRMTPPLLLTLTFLLGCGVGCPCRRTRRSSKTSSRARRSVWRRPWAGWRSTGRARSVRPWQD